MQAGQTSGAFTDHNVTAVAALPYLALTLGKDLCHLHIVQQGTCLLYTSDVYKRQAIQHIRQIFQKLAAGRPVHRVKEHRLFIQQAVGVVAYAPGNEMCIRDRIGSSFLMEHTLNRGSTVAHFTVALLPLEPLHVVHRSGEKSFRQAVGRSR